MHVEKQTKMKMNDKVRYSATQERRNVTQSEGASETSVSSGVKTNLSTMDFYADLCFPRPGESFSI